jgi:hypothetical protein
MCLFEVRKRSAFPARSVSPYESWDKRCREKPRENGFIRSGSVDGGGSARTFGFQPSKKGSL